MIVAVVILVISLLIVTVFAFLGTDITVMRRKHPILFSSKRITESRFDTMFGEDIKRGREWIASVPCREQEITSYDGTRLFGRFYRNGESKQTVLLLHGYRSDPMHDFSCAFKFYFDKGFNLLVPDQRAHGRSGGKIITYGVRERYDAKCWIEQINRLVPDGEIYANGVSMGASTLLMATSLELPDNLRGIIADCGFTSPGAIIRKVIKENMRLPVFPVYNVIRFSTRIIAGFDFEEYSAVTAVRESKVPILMLHGKEDCFVPFSMGEEIFEAVHSKKQAVWVDGADHGCSFMIDREGCTKALYGFLGI
ncbi:MAG: alpha/beta hydrolase [Clostridia bacterium]|nr:alpha/beta hydrolase [Clostridia bacterium]